MRHWEKITAKLYVVILFVFSCCETLKTKTTPKTNHIVDFFIYTLPNEILRVLRCFYSPWVIDLRARRERRIAPARRLSPSLAGTRNRRER